MFSECLVKWDPFNYFFFFLTKKMLHCSEKVTWKKKINSIWRSQVFNITTYFFKTNELDIPDFTLESIWERFLYILTPEGHCGKMGYWGREKDLLKSESLNCLKKKKNMENGNQWAAEIKCQPTLGISPGEGRVKFNSRGLPLSCGDRQRPSHPVGSIFSDITYRNREPCSKKKKG